MIVVLGQTPAIRRDLVTHLQDLGITASEAADVSEAIERAESSTPVEGILFHDSLGLVELLAWPRLLEDTTAGAVKSILHSTERSAFERNSIKKRYSTAITDTDELLAYLRERTAQFVSSIGPDFPLKSTLDEESDAKKHSGRQAEDNQAANNQAEDNQTIRDQTEATEADEPTELIRLAESLHESIPERQKHTDSGSTTDVFSGPESKQPCPDPTHIDALQNLIQYAKRSYYGNLLGLPFEATNSEIRERAEELTQRLNEYLHQHLDGMNPDDRTDINRIHVAIAEAVIVLTSRVQHAPR